MHTIRAKLGFIALCGASLIAPQLDWAGLAQAVIGPDLIFSALWLAELAALAGVVWLVSASIDRQYGF